MTRSDFPIIGVTGNSGSGKTTVAEMLGEFGGFVVNADRLSHAAILRGTEAYAEIVSEFGEGILSPDGEIDRKKLGEKVFGRRDSLSKLEKIIHPRVCEETFRLIEQAKASGNFKFAVIDAPLLIETEIHARCSSVWVVVARFETKIKRIVGRDGISPEDALKRIGSQHDDVNYLSRYASVVIENDCGLEELKTKTAEAFRGESEKIGLGCV